MIPAQPGEHRCVASSWRGNSRFRSQPYGPGGFNRCRGPMGHAGIHEDEWGNRFTVDVATFKVVGQGAAR